MTARAKSLTARATAPATPPDRRWSMPATEIRAFLDALGALHYNVDSLLAASGVRESDLHDPDARVSCEALGQMVSVAQRERVTPNLAIELARVTPVGAYPLLDYLVATSESVCAGVEQLTRYLRLVGTPAEITTHEEKDGVQIVIADGASPFNVEYSAALLVLHFRAETEGRFSAITVSVRHIPDDVQAMARVLGCEVRARLPLRRRDSLLRRLLEAQADQILAQLPERTGLAQQVQRALTRRLDAASTGVDTIARQLAMSSRTLQRRLANEGVSYQQLLDAARKEAARRYLAESSLAIGEVAYLVGYSEPAPFHRAFKRWYGVTPEVFRRTEPGESPRG
jgi:AraC-like DNA-binding protein